MTTTISSYSVLLGLDAKDYIKGSMLSARETNKLKREIESAKTPVDKFTQTYDLLEKALQSGSITLDVYKRVLDDARTKMQKYEQSTDAAKQAQLELNKSLAEAKAKIDAQSAALMKTEKHHSTLISQVKGLVAAYVGFRTITKSIDLAVQLEQAQVQFEVLTGSANNAKVLLAELRDFAAKSPITFSGAVDAAKTMLLFNVNIKDVMRNIKALGEITGGNTERFKNLTLAFAQMSSAGRLMGGELRQMVEAGFNPLQQISEKTGEDFMVLKKRMEDANISTAEATQAFIDATGAGGRFNGMTERLAETMGGKMTIAMSELEQVGVRLGEALSPLVITLTRGFSEGIGPLSSILGLISKMADGLGFVTAIATDAAHAIYLPFAALSGTLDKAGTPDAIKTFLDMMDKRDAERAAAKNAGPLSLKLDDTKQPVHMLSEAVQDLGKAAEETEKKVEDKTKAIKEQERIAAQLAKLEQDRFAQALQNAQKYFDDERKKAADRQKQILGTPNSVLEVGSEADSRFMNARRLAFLNRGNVAGQQGEPTQRQLLLEAQKQHAALLAAEKKQAKQVELLGKILEQQKKNGFKRIR